MPLRKRSANQKTNQKKKQTVELVGEDKININTPDDDLGMNRSSHSVDYNNTSLTGSNYTF